MARGDGAHGKQLLAEFECNRCHMTSAVEVAPHEKQCTGCHSDILRGEPKGTRDQIARWRGKVVELGDVPSLEQTGTRFRRDWLVSFLRAPHDLRPSLVPSMPRLALDEKQALDIATYLAPLEDDEPHALDGANVARGEELAHNKGCALCHRFDGATMTGVLLPTGVTPPDLPRAMRLAPDLKHTRARFRTKALVDWLEHPSLVKPDTLMPELGLTREQARDVAAYLVKTPLAPATKKTVPARLPVLTRAVTYDEVASRVFRKTCWHCHGEPDFERGDGGPGNSGGFGFKGKGIDLSSYPATFAGWVDEKGERTSLFAPSKDGSSYLVASLVARQHEEAGELPELRGMPLGMPALAPDELQLVETWIAQGRKR
jgi:cytochrome c2